MAEPARTLQFRYPATKDPTACPTCNATGKDPCLSRGGRDHPRRKRKT